ncbi:hypothetical protein EJB05_57835, partial [Eragrostis curvula]
MMHLGDGGESKASSLMTNKVLRPLLCLVVVFYDHDCWLDVGQICVFSNTNMVKEVTMRLVTGSTTTRVLSYGISVYL